MTGVETTPRASQVSEDAALTLRRKTERPDTHVPVSSGLRSSTGLHDGVEFVVFAL